MRINNKNRIAAAAIALLVAVTAVGCNYLDHYPRGTRDSDELLSTEEGFKYALTGIYLQLSSTNLYGRNTSFYVPEMLCRHWTVDPDETTNLNIFSNYHFEDYRGNDILSTMWSSYYRAIAQCNDILDKLDNVEFSTGTKELIEGEALGLRGLLHLEILRYWGPLPSEATATTKAIPYVKEITLETDRLLSSSWKNVTDNILSDLSRAEEILAEHDPMTKYTLDTLNYRVVSTSPVDQWAGYRQNHMNYGAVLGAKARLYSWIEPSNIITDAAEMAATYAQMVLDIAHERTGAKQFLLQNKSSFNPDGFILFGECIFALHVQNLQTTIRSPFISSPPTLLNSKANLDVAYEVSQPWGSEDMRYTDTKMWEEKQREGYTTTYMHFQKYGGNPTVADKLTTLTRNQIPVMKLPEMYFILMEYLPHAEALEVFKTFRTSRSMSAAVEDTFTEVNKINRLESEYRKEFFGEGQMFFFYKKHAYTSFPWPGFILPKGLADYHLPRPRAQEQFDK